MLNSVKGKGISPLMVCGKKSIFFDLSYWKNLYVRHNLDVMHTEKNVCESLIGTLLNMPGKTKDGENTRLDMVEMGIRVFETYNRVRETNILVIILLCFI